MCFIAMPFGTRPAKRGMKIDFNRVYELMHRGAEAAGLDSIRTDFERPPRPTVSTSLVFDANFMALS